MPASPNAADHPRAWSLRDGRWIILGPLLVQLTLFFQFSPGLNYVQVAHRWGVLTLRPPFSDLSFIAGAGATLRAGGNPYVVNAFDPLGRAYNYPPLWLYLSWHTTVSPGMILILAVAMGLFGLGAFVWYLGPVDWRRGLLLGALACSPPVVLAVQRANADILMLGLVALALVWLRQGRRVAAYACLVLATWLKLYPVFTLVVLLREPWNRLRRVGPIVVLAGGLCFAVYAGDLGYIFANTPVGGLHSYGARVLAFWGNFFLPSYGWNVNPVLLGRVCSLAAVTLALVACRIGYEKKLPLDSSLDSELDGFRVGAAVYVSTFLLSVSFDYRLLFLLLVFPLLFSLSTRRTPSCGWALAGLILIFGVMWPNGLFWKPLILVKEASSWALFFTLTVLLVRTLPRPLFARA
ncbi:MAG: glycosyltransferase family 87 protein [Opitutaceae bacterium]